MKKLTTLLLAGSLLVGFSSVTMAQTTDNATISANATVVPDMAVGNESEDLNFGNILVNSAKFIDESDGSVDATAEGTSGEVDGITGGESRGYISIEIAGGVMVDLTLAVPSNLEDGSNTLQIGFGESGIDDESGNLNGRITQTKPSGTSNVISGGLASTMGVSVIFKTNDGNVWELEDPFPMPPSGKVYLALGGEVSATSDQALGSYAGDITLTATVAD